MSELRIKEGITRNIDVLGRIVIPIAWRKKYGISTGAKIGVILRENEIILKKKELEDIKKQFDIYKAKMESLLISQLELIKDVNKEE